MMNQGIINCQILDLIENYVRDCDGLSLKLLGFTGDITVNAYSFPSSFDYEEARTQLKKLKYKNSVHLLNATYRKLGISELNKTDFKKCVDGESEYWYLHITFNTPILPELRTYLKSQIHHFIIFLTDPEAVNDRGFRLMYSSNNFFNYTEEFDRSICIDLDEIESVENGNYKISISQLESVIYGICKTIGIEIPDRLQSAVLDRLKIEPPTLATFECFLKLVTRDCYDDLEYQKDAKSLEILYRQVVGEIDVEIDVEAANVNDIMIDGYDEIDAEIGEEAWHVDIRVILDSYEMTYYSDWKFDPENIEWAISNILGEDFTFEYPENTYSHDLFPYIQSALKQKNLELMNIDTFGDSYLFFIANIDDVDRILEISQTIDLSVERL
jgi:hypothetical protein